MEQDLESIILIQAMKIRNAGSTMSIEEIAALAMQEHKRKIKGYARFNAGQMRKFGSKNWSTGHVIQYLQDKSE
jgi:hypothetical protein